MAASCDMPGVLPPHVAVLPASEMTPEARARQALYQNATRARRREEQKRRDAFMKTFMVPKSLEEARRQLMRRVMANKTFPDDLMDDSELDEVGQVS